MKKACRLLVLASLGAALAAPAAAQVNTASPADITGVGNFSHIVADMDRALRFYRDVIGLEPANGASWSPNLAIMTT